jgi:hypothetical protein
MAFKCGAAHSPVEPLDSRNCIEVAIPAQNAKAMLPAESSDPEIIGRNRLSHLQQLNIDRCVVMRGP